MSKYNLTPKVKESLHSQIIEQYFPNVSNTKLYKHLLNSNTKGGGKNFYVNTLFKIKYDGTKFSGLQKQFNKITVEECLRYAFKMVGLIEITDDKIHDVDINDVVNSIDDLKKFFQINNRDINLEDLKLNNSGGNSFNSCNCSSNSNSINSSSSSSISNSSSINTNNININSCNISNINSNISNINSNTRNTTTNNINTINTNGKIENKFVFCGRTDSEVSAKSMPISIFCKLNSKFLKKDIININDYKMKNLIKPNFIRLLNYFLPEFIILKSLDFVKKDFSCRFDCKKRSYRYYFNLKYRNKKLNVNKMAAACKELEKREYWKNFCKNSWEKSFIKRTSKSSNTNTSSTNENINSNITDEINNYYKRKLSALKIKKSKKILNNKSYKYYLRVKGRSFLHNMVRRIFYYLREVGLGNTIDINDFIGTAEGTELEFRRGEYNEIQYI